MPNRPEGLDLADVLQVLWQDVARRCHLSVMCNA